MDRLILRMLPAEFRARHGEEIEEMLASSRRPVRDRVDLGLTALALRFGRALRVLVVVAAAASCVAAVAVVIALDDLTGGARDVHRHWWSTIAVLWLGVSVAATVVVGFAQRRVTDVTSTR